MERFLKPKPVRQPDRIMSTDGFTYQMDLKTHMVSDDGYKMILVLVNIYTKEVDAEPLKKKTMNQVKDALELMIKRKNIRSIRSIRRICVDKGSEFNNKVMRDYLATKHIDLIPENTTYHYNATAIVERMISTITKPLTDFIFIKRKSGFPQYNRWVDNLKKVVAAVNEANVKEGPRVSPEERFEPAIIPKKIFQLGDVVYRRFPQPTNEVNGKKKFVNFRNKDPRFNYKEPFVVTGYRVRHNRPLRYLLNDDNSISYADHEIIS